MKCPGLDPSCLKVATHAVSLPGGVARRFVCAPCGEQIQRNGAAIGVSITLSKYEWRPSDVSRLAASLGRRTAGSK